jgi:hypothetical protein
MARDGLGVMVHYLISPPGDTDCERTAAFDATVDSFDVPGFVRQLQVMGAHWLIFTIGQNTGYYCSPNPVLDRAVPGHTSRRDLALEIAGALDTVGIRTILYLPAEVMIQAPDIQAAFGWDPPDYQAFLERYLAFVEAYSRRFGTLAQGWWFDGCYEPIHHNRWDWGRWCAAARAGNPNGAVAFNDGSFCVGRVQPLSPLQDYHAGEVHLLEDGRIRTDFLNENVVRDDEGRLRKQGQEPTFHMPESQSIDGVQWQALVPLDSTFNPAVPTCRYSDAELIGFARACRAVRGAVTLNLPIDNAGHIPDSTVDQVRRVFAATEAQ